VRPPVLPRVPAADARTASSSGAGLLTALGALGLGAAVMWRGRP